MKRILPILSFLLFSVIYSSAQESRNPIPDAGKRMSIYPNPATSFITFDVQKINQKGLTIVVFNFLGKKMYETPRITDKVTVTLTDFNRGIYIYHLKDQSGKIIESGKFQVSK